MTNVTSRDPEQTRQRILGAASDLFVDKGFAGVTLREVAQHSGVTKSLIHHHFGSKEALWGAVLEHNFARYYIGQKAELVNAAESLPELLQDGVRRYFHFLRDNPQMLRLFAWGLLAGDAKSGEMDIELVSLGAEHVRNAQQQGLLRDDINPSHVMATFIYVCTQWFLNKKPHADWPGLGTDEAFLEDFLKIFMEGLLPRN